VPKTAKRTLVTMRGAAWLLARPDQERVTAHLASVNPSNRA
jgi:hypothetical protein